jgi:hypothetical protein
VLILSGKWGKALKRGKYKVVPSTRIAVAFLGPRIDCNKKDEQVSVR